MFIEADILIGTSSPNPIMAHPPYTTSDLTFSEFLKELKSTSKGLKLDFKDINALEPCLNELETQKDNVSNHLFQNILFLNLSYFRSMVQLFSMLISFKQIHNVQNQLMPNVF